MFNLRLRNASLSGGMTPSMPKAGPASFSSGWLRQHPPPQQSGCNFCVPAWPTFSNIRLISSEFWEMRTVDARRRPLHDPPSSFCRASSSWATSCGSAGGVNGAAAWVSGSGWEMDKALKLVSVIDSEWSRGSSGIGLSGCEVDDTGMPRWSPLENDEFEAIVLDDGGEGGRTACTIVCQFSLSYASLLDCSLPIFTRD